MRGGFFSIRNLVCFFKLKTTYPYFFFKSNIFTICTIEHFHFTLDNTFRKMSLNWIGHSIRQTTATKNTKQHSMKMRFLFTQTNGMSAQTQVGTFFPINNIHNVNSLPAKSKHCKANNHGDWFWICSKLSRLNYEFTTGTLWKGG